MKRTFKRILASLLVVVMTMTAIPLSGIDFGEIFVSKVNAKTIEEYSVGDIIEFGSYPQSKVTDETLISDIKEAGNTVTWVDYGYYAGTENSADGNMKPIENMMRYKDIQYGGNMYRAVEINQYRPNRTGYISSASYTYQDDNGYKTGNTYYFKYEPLTWRVLDPSEGFVMCTKAIDAQAYQNFVYLRSGSGIYYNDITCTNYASDWSTSSIREWLNDDFFNTAFTYSEKAQIITTDNKNISAYESKYDSINTSDKIFLLSYFDTINSNYGFSSDCSSQDTARQLKTTDYAQCQGCLSSTSKSYFGNAQWWLRSPGNSASSAITYFHGITFSHDFHVYYTSRGVVPAFKFNPKSSIDEDDSETESIFYEKSYIADNLLDRHGFGTTMASKQLKDILSYSSESAVIYDDLKNNDTFQLALGAWDGLGYVFEPTDKVKEVLNKSQIYEALIFDFIKYALNDEDSEINSLINDVNTKINSSMQTGEEAVSKYYDIAKGLSDSFTKSGQTFANIKKTLKTTGSVPNTISIYLESDEFKKVSKLDEIGVTKTLKFVGDAIEVAETANEFYERLNLYYIAYEMSIEMVNYLTEMRSNSTDSAFREALTDIIKSFNNYDYAAKVCSINLGANMTLDFLGGLIDDVISVSSIAWLYESWKLAYEAGKAFVNVMLNTDGIISKYYMCEAAKNISDASVKTINSLASKYISSGKEADAGAYIYAVSCHRFIWNIDLDSAGEFIKAASEEGLVNLSKKLTNSIISKITENETETTYERFVKNKDSIMQSLMNVFDYIFTAWKYDEQYLKTDYPDLYPIYIESDLSADSCKPTIVSAELNKDGKTDVVFSSSIGYIDKNGYFRQNLASGYLESFNVSEEVGSDTNTKTIDDGYKYNSSTYSWNLSTTFYNSGKFTTFPKTYTVQGISTCTGTTIYTQKDSKEVASPTAVELINNVDSLAIYDTNNVELSDITTYHIYRRNIGSKSFSEIDTLKRSSNIFGFLNMNGYTVFKDKTAEKGKAYEYKVVKELNFTNGVTLKGESKIIAKKYWSDSEISQLNVYSNEAGTSSMHSDNLVLATASLTESDGITLKWEKVNNATGYEIYRISSYGSYYRIIDTVDSSTTSYVDTSVEEGISYRYKVIPYFLTSNNENLYSDEIIYEGSYIAEVTPNASTCSHTYDSGKIVLSATKHCDGVKCYTCTKCGAVKTEAIKFVLGKVNSVSISDVTLTVFTQPKIFTTISADSGVTYTTAWKSSDTSVATVDSNGNVTGIKAGTATITCTVEDQYGNVVSDTCTVTVIDNSTISSDVIFSLNLISETETEVKVAVSLGKGYFFALDGTIIYSSSLKLKSFAKSEKFKSVLIEDDNLLASTNVNTGKFSIACGNKYSTLGEIYILTFTKLSKQDINNSDISMIITNCEADKNINPTVINCIKNDIGKVKSVSIDDISLNYKKSTTITPKIDADSGVTYTVEYESSNPKVATVDENGKVTATKRGSGSATITCTVTDQYGNTVTDDCKVNVSLTFGQKLLVYVLFGWIWY